MLSPYANLWSPAVPCGTIVDAAETCGPFSIFGWLHTQRRVIDIDARKKQEPFYAVTRGKGTSGASSGCRI
jgi:hypothetical protein